MRELWTNASGIELEVSWDDMEDGCFYKYIPPKNKNTIWDGFSTIEKLLERGFFYVKTL